MLADVVMFIVFAADVVGCWLFVLNARFTLLFVFLFQTILVNICFVHTHVVFCSYVFAIICCTCCVVAFCFEIIISRVFVIVWSVCDVCVVCGEVREGPRRL